jgi:division protein CdvB (Snf7/Vps24/ESCRT-III family)
MFRGSQSFADKIREAIKPTPIKRRIQIAAYKLRNQTTRLDKSMSQMEARDRTLHDKCVKALEARDTRSATLFANECVEIRKLIKTSLSSQICLEQALLRLETIEEFGDMVHGMGSVRGILASVKGELEGKLPEISTGIHDVEDSLESLTMEIGEAVDSDGNYVLPSDESAKILKEADLMAEQKMREKFPEIPQIPGDAHRLR